MPIYGDDIITVGAGLQSFRRGGLRQVGNAGGLRATATTLLGATPLHYWDFTQNRALFNGVDVGAVTSTPNWSFSRASTGYANQTPNVNFGTTNLCLQSQTLTAVSWVGTRASVIADVGVDPNGSYTADKLVEDTTASDTHVLQQFIVLPISTLTYSIYAKAAERSQIVLFVPAAAFGDATVRSANFNLATGTTGATTGSGTTSSITAVGNGWYRCVMTTSATSVTTGINFQLRLAVSGSEAYTGNGSGLFVWGVQIELGTAVSGYKPTTTVAVTDLSGPPLVSFGINVPRITNKGLLVEDGRNNVLLQSQTLATAPWIPFQSSITANATAAPDGTTTADKLVEDTTAASTHFHQQIVNLTASVQTFSIYAKAAERTQTSIFVPTTAFADATFRTALFDLTGAGTVLSVTASATASIEALAGGWYRCILNVPATLAVAANIQYGLLVAGNPTYTGNGTSGLFLWGAQVEASTVHSSYIPTTTVTVARPADIPYVSSPGVDYPLAIYSEFNRTIGAFPTNTVAFTVSDGTQNNRTTNIILATTSQSNPLVAAAGVTQYGPSINPALAANVTTKIATRAGASSANSARDAVLDTATGAISVSATPTLISMGMNSSFTGQLNGYLLRAAIFNSAVTDAQLQRMTT